MYTPNETLYQKPIPSIQTRWYTYENRSAKKGAAGNAGFGRKGSPAHSIAAGETFVIADIKQSGTTGILIDRKINCLPCSHWRNARQIYHNFLKSTQSLTMLVKILAG